ncbi:NUDIX domain-containing protein [Schumannella luteola]|uniref:ADP-ribose pyrophosphatase YjhB (NUDIX family) n=1 Tax=Schumannella luteola TaxID=472059 RepID=A0A852YBC6_9MICO|nr:NUDIX domain-containing protein [Schumannella luteola]NYG99142.1 ADP-ribose pyrophosphatase YjhB (NUDIX family) [Schumannella luteola]TPX02339.1 NUDIX hydrolase [Schumannella luteola]
MVYRDHANNTLEDYPRPSVAVDTAVLTLDDAGELAVLLVRDSHDQGLRLPGTFLHPGETLSDAVQRSLVIKTGLSPTAARHIAPRQLRVFDAPDRDPRGWVLSVAHLAAAPRAELEVDADRVAITPVTEVGDPLYQHRAIIDLAVAELRERYREAPDPVGFAPAITTLRALHAVHSAIAGIALPRDAFRRTMEPLLASTGELERGGVGKPARLFRRT